MNLRSPERDPLELIEHIASECHEANRVYCISIGDTSHKSWAEAPDWQKSTVRTGVIKAIEGATPRDLHGSWMAQKIAEGWVHGEIKDPEKKTHPCIVPYDQLPHFQRQKDMIFRDTVQIELRAAAPRSLIDLGRQFEAAKYRAAINAADIPDSARASLAVALLGVK